MVLLEKQAAIFHRNDKGELIPEDVKLETLDGDMSIIAIPLTRGQLKEIYANLKKSGETTKDQDSMIILTNCIEPKFSEKEVADLKPQIATAIVAAIMSISLGIDQKTFISQTTKAVMEQQEDNLVKK